MVTHNRPDFITLELAPICGDYVDDFDLDEVFSDLLDIDVILLGREGFYWNEELDYETSMDLIVKALEKHDKKLNN